jgi:hypothetical protein
MKKTKQIRFVQFFKQYDWMVRGRTRGEGGANKERTYPKEGILRKVQKYFFWDGLQ